MIIEVFAVRAEARERHRLGQAVHVAIAVVVVIMCSVGVVGALLGVSFASTPAIIIHVCARWSDDPLV
mgnify:CR=1 FL=1